VPFRTAVPDGRGDGCEQAARGRAQGRAAGGGRRGVQHGERGTVHGHAPGTELGPTTGQPHRSVRVRGRRGVLRRVRPLGTARPVCAAPGRPAVGQPASQHRSADGRRADGGRDRADGQLPEVPDHTASGSGPRRYTTPRARSGFSDSIDPFILFFIILSHGTSGVFF